MSRLTNGAGRFIAEALILLPALALGVVWTGVVASGLFHASAVMRHRPVIEELMTLLLLVCIVCFSVGVVLFSATRRRRWTR
jgi:Mn2+/Fe2+ NRAMP family transporter